jgi:predicted nucleotidyltransferase
MVASACGEVIIGFERKFGEPFEMSASWGLFLFKPNTGNLNFEYNKNMNSKEIAQILKTKKDKLEKEFGVKSLQLFGSVARDEATSSSDVELLVEFNRPMGYFGLFALQDYLEKLLDCPVDLGTKNSLRPNIRENVMKDLVYVA